MSKYQGAEWVPPCTSLTALLLKITDSVKRIPVFLENVNNPLNAELNLICHLLALLGSHPILHVSRIRDNLEN